VCVCMGVWVCVVLLRKMAEKVSLVLVLCRTWSGRAVSHDFLLFGLSLLRFSIDLFSHRGLEAGS
jgi:hypothetical protein